MANLSAAVDRVYDRLTHGALLLSKCLPEQGDSPFQKIETFFKFGHGHGANFKKPSGP